MWGRKEAKIKADIRTLKNAKGKDPATQRLIKQREKELQDLQAQQRAREKQRAREAQQAQLDKDHKNALEEHIRRRRRGH